jgi:hypothetical protein
VVDGVLRVRRLPGFVGPDGLMVSALLAVCVEADRVR